MLSPLLSGRRGALSTERPAHDLADFSVAAYLLATAALLAGPLREVPGAGPRLAAHLAGVLLILAVRGRLAAAPPGKACALRLLHTWYPLALLPFLYKGVDFFGQALHGRYYDDLALAWEGALFGTSPALWLCEAAPWRSLSEFLHLCYMAYWFYTGGLGLRLLLAGRQRDFQAFMFTSMNTYMLCYLGFIAFPVTGPREIWPPIPESLQGPLYALCHLVMGRGAAVGAAFPSCHTAVAVVTAAAAWRFDRASFPLVALLASGTAAATVYGRFHYAVDTLAGIALALVVLRFLGWGLFERLAPRGRGRRECPSRHEEPAAREAGKDR